MVVLPKKFEEILNKDTKGYYIGAVKLTASKFDQIFSENRLYFFEEYTDHGIRHINSVLEACANLITPETYTLLSEKDISILVLSVFLHDLGMHLQPLTFKKMVTGGYDDVLNTDFGDQKWSVLWENYLFEARKFNDQQRINIFGDAGVDFKVPDLNNPDSLTGVHRKLIGEFIRRHHPRIAFEVAFKGLAANDGTQIDFCSDFDFKHKLLAGLLARSHGMNIRDTIHILEKHFTKKVWRHPINVHIVYLMALIRLADYFQIDTSRVLKVPYLTRQFKSPVSFAEHQKHLQTTYIQDADDDPETLFITAEPSNSTYFLALEKLFKDIQNEVDNSWAVLGEVYGSKPYEEQPKLAYRRIRSTLDDKRSFEESVNFVPEKISFIVDKEIPKLLVGPLYTYEPTYGVRELLQNAVDACWEREFYEKKKGNVYEAEVLIKVEPLNDQFLFSITDNGKGMTLDEISNYFLKVGGSFRKSEKWQHDHVDEKGHSNVNKSGRFGIGVLAAFLLGTEIEIKTRNISSQFGYTFKTALEQEQIEILKMPDLDFGTTISILISASKLYDLYVGHKKRNLFSLAHIKFDEWFVLKSPMVKYVEPENYSRKDRNIKEFYSDRFPELDEYSIYWNEILVKDYRKIVWSYPDKFISSVICNGFVVPDRYSLKDQRLSAPAIMIFDFDAKLPLNLSRTSVDSPLPFNDILEIDIYKDIIASLLVMEVESIFITHNVTTNSSCFDHDALNGDGRWGYLNSNNAKPLHLVLGKEGYLLSVAVAIRELVEKNHLMILSLDESDLSIPAAIKCLIENDEINFVSVIDLSDLDEPDSYFNDIERTLFKLQGVTVKGFSSDVYTVFENENPDWFSNCKQEINLLETVNDVSLVYLRYGNIEVKKDKLSKLLIDFLGEDLLIPYNLEDRKKKFPKAFKELEPYMRKYLKEK